MEISPYLLVHKLVVQGTTKQYTAIFREGLNVIWGDLDSGKSSILHLIDYCLGGKNTKLTYEEIKTHGRIAFLEVDLNGNIFTFEREIHSDAAPIRVYPGDFENRSRNFPFLMSGFPNKAMPDGWVSDFILDNLGIAKVSIKESKYRDDASSDRLSFRDLMKLIYLKQTRIGSDTLLDYPGQLFNKNVEIQKFVFDIYDDKLSGLLQELSSASSELAELEKNERFIRKFLQDVKIDVGDLKKLDDDVEERELLLSELEADLELIKRDVALSADVGMAISIAVTKLRTEIRQNESTLLEIEKKYENLVKLSNTYRFELDALELSQMSRNILHVGHPLNKFVPCPLCATPLAIESPFVEDADLSHQIKSIKNRDAGIQQMLAHLRNQQQSATEEHAVLTNELKIATRTFDEKNIASISPLISSIETIEKSRTDIKLQLAEASRNSAIANKYISIGAQMEAKATLISNLKRTKKVIEEGLVGLDSVVSELTTLLHNYMHKSGLQKVTDVSFDKRFTAFFRGISYYNTSSGGVRTITSIAMFITRLQYLLTKPGNLPTFLMIDTPGQNIGRHRDTKDASEVSDPKLYENIFKQIIEITLAAHANGRVCQVIVVDNDLPDCLIEGENFHLVKRYSKDGGELEKGLINDA